VDQKGVPNYTTISAQAAVSTLSDADSNVIDHL
jgi:hypothetical protein